MVGPHDGAVDHLHAVRFRSTVSQRFEHQLPDPGQCPAPELAIDRAPLAEILMQVAPLRTGPRNPEDAIKDQPVIARRATALAPARHDEGLKERPLRIRHQTANHDRLRKSDLESLFEPPVNPICQQDLELRSSLSFANCLCNSQFTHNLYTFVLSVLVHKVVNRISEFDPIAH